jgi:hypothetical protein
MAPEPDRPWWLPPPVRVHAAWWVVLAAALLWIEYATGLHRQFPLLYVIPVSLAAWYSGKWPALGLAMAVPAVHLAFAAQDSPGTDLAAVGAQTAFRTTVVFVMVLWFARLSEHEHAHERKVQALERLLPICSFCKSIRNDVGEWERLEGYISRRSETKFSHGVCPSCQRIHYAEFAGDESLLGS